MNKLFLPVNTGLLIETYKRGDFFDLVTFSKELFYKGDNINKCRAAMFLADSYSREGYIREAFKWNNLTQKYCPKNVSKLFNSYIQVYINTTEAGKAISALNTLQRSLKTLRCTLTISFYAKAVRFKELRQNIKKCNKTIGKEKLNRLRKEILLVKVKVKFFKNLPRAGVLPGMGELLMGRKEEAVGAVFMTSISTLGLIHSLSNKGYFEFWLFPLITYYLGSINRTYKVSVQETRTAYFTYTRKINSIFLNKKTFLEILALTFK